MSFRLHETMSRETRIRPAATLRPATYRRSCRRGIPALMTVQRWDSAGDDEMTVPGWLQHGVRRLEDMVQLDRVTVLVDQAARPVGAGRTGQALRGQWLGHALHPLLTDLPLGCWLGAGLLDLVGGQRGRDRARRLVGLGLVAAVPTALAGLAEFAVVRDARSRRVAAVHGLGNAAVVALYVKSWSARPRSRTRGVMWGLAGGSLAWMTGYLGGHLSFARGVGVGPRGIDVGDATSGTLAATGADLVSLAEAARLLTVQPAQVVAMVEEGMLMADGVGEEMRLQRAEVMAARQLGG